MSNFEPFSPVEFVRLHGAQAHQLVVDEIVRAITRNDDDAATAWDAELRVVEAELHRTRDGILSTGPDRVR
ncbi:hypothetical protein [Sphingomonas xinjiangensis]|uniref:Uncharacterized protein n=1 Tax=Sphingomonas xinjiangensis TaxID=643568 RepID=A0A840YTV2_9SPHN|nr:hypothetical protein [Sphingomonas xinjiangensis]MBB5713072.1 hypothetical protein [Sphingomonas xinjiangensis]